VKWSGGILKTGLSREGVSWRGALAVWVSDDGGTWLGDRKRMRIEVRN
jgi:hypothetical protein